MLPVISDLQPIPDDVRAENCRMIGLASSFVTFSETEKARAAAWKARTETLPPAAKQAAPYIGKDGRPGTAQYDFCLPAEFAEYTLLPEIRSDALELFAELGIPWHASVHGGPSNHLVSSQVQCVNALARMVTDPSRLVAAFGPTLGTAEVLEIEPGRHLTFEYIGPEDFFGEATHGARIRGAHCTSVDAAFVHRTDDGLVELVLVEWKYTESYRLRTPDPARDRARMGRYADAVADPDGPVRGDLLATELLFDEPFYQLTRQQLLAHALERTGAEDAQRVRVVHVLSPANDAYQQSLARPEHRALGETVSVAWQQLLRAKDRFVSMHPDVFLDPTVTSPEYASRYGERQLHNDQDVLDEFGVPDLTSLEDVIDFEGEIFTSTHGLELLVGNVGTVIEYPFTQDDLRRLSDEVETEYTEAIERADTEED
ncbi:MAG: PGN_0703 family putative restriction endonuclease [Jatrophihabitantaceae bacterium]